LLTDYHVHLRPDEEGSTAERYFTPSNVDRYREAADERGIAELGVAEHIHRFVQSLDIWQHPWYRYWAEDDVDEYCDFVREQGLKLGIEADFLPGREDRVANMLDGRPWDYVVGSVHFMGEDAVDVHGEPDWESWDIWRGADPEKVWSRYFETLGEAARTGMFDILAHPDLVKVFGDRVPMPDGDLRRFYDRAMEGIAESDVAVEVSTAGRLPGDVPRGGPPCGAVERRAHAGAARVRVRARRGVAGRARCERAVGVRGPRQTAGADRVRERAG
jgi:histidinol-phosphatase (PHP family)